MTFYMRHNAWGNAQTATPKDEYERDSAGYAHGSYTLEKFDQPRFWKTDMLPEPLRHKSGHDGSHTFLTHEFIDALLSVEEAIALL